MVGRLGKGKTGVQAEREETPAPTLFTVGHGTLSGDQFAALVASAGIHLVVDVRSAPGSRRHPHFGRLAMEQWLPAAGVAYRWEPDLGGYRRPVEGSPNTALHHPSFRGYADYMATASFAAGLRHVLDEARTRPTAVMCAETLWWRCHRRLVADAAVLLFGAEVRHLGHDGRLSAHQLTEGARLRDVRGVATVVYDAAAPTRRGAA